MEYINDKTTIKYMYRYLEKFTGTYRVLPDLDLSLDDFPTDENGKLEESFEDLYIPCKRGVIKHTYLGNDILAWCCYDKIVTGKNVIKELKDAYKKTFDFDSEIDGNDVFVYFNAKDIDKIAKVVSPRTSGAKIKWNSNKNLPKADYEVPSNDLDELNSLLCNLDKQQKMLFSKDCNNHFIEDNKLKDEYKNSRMKSKEFIHSKGLWDKYLKYVKKELEAYK